MAAVLTITMSMLCQGRSYQCEAHSLSLPMLNLHQEPIHTRFLAQRSGTISRGASTLTCSDIRATTVAGRKEGDA
jgi:hypothetical protein